MHVPSTLATVLAGLVVAPQLALALSATAADDYYTAWNKALLSTEGNQTFYRKRTNETNADSGWSGTFDIQGTMDVYERTGDPATKTLINELATTWDTRYGKEPWTDEWNDDLGWTVLMLARASQITSTESLLAKAEYGFSLVYNRGWDAQSDGGGIWEKQDHSADGTKNVLSTDSIGKSACYLYQTTLNQTYLTKAEEIYAWTRKNLYNTKTGAVYTFISVSGKVETATAAYNQGTFIDIASLLWEMTGNVQYFNDAKLAIAFAKSSLTVNGIFSNTHLDLNSWADEAARGIGHYVRDNGLWSEYHDWMVQNADAIEQNARPKLGLTWNGWTSPTPDTALIANQYVSGLAWLQKTPVQIPSAIQGIHIITNVKSGLAIDSIGNTGDGSRAGQAVQSTTSVSQRWLITSNSDGSWNMINTANWKSLESTTSSSSGAALVQATRTGEADQRWLIVQQANGFYQITNQASKLVVDGGSGTTSALIESTASKTNSSSQSWILHSPLV